ncbi:DUF4404 family protein [Tautonia plasticadhaerens]|uniref:DUF4404 domain-containing protein n=1 Tax=Tautonia plasticadhaerens TaxID=2527974 RepID=A0A518GWX1_9BACT|nr:DUF4404 family protein [Tautonia plasticadhaerens]QDV33088.1 hypothetical protein ElP_09300 [Tautonia plasticadhaerens]
MSQATPPPADPEHLARLRTDLVESARLLRDAHHLDPEERARLAELIDELGQALDPAAPPETAAHLASSASALARALHERRDEGLLSSTRARLDEAAAHAEAEAPFATQVVRRFLDLLAQIGI